MPFASIPIVSAWYLIGQTRVRRTWRGKLVLQVAEGRRRGSANHGPERWGDGMEIRWRDASIYDLQDMHSGKPLDESDQMPKPTPRPTPPRTGSGAIPT